MSSTPPPGPSETPRSSEPCITGTMVYHHRTQGADAQGIHIHEMIRAFDESGWQICKVALHRDESVGSESRPGLLSRLVARLPAAVYELLEIGYTLPGTIRLLLAIRRCRPRFVYERYSLFNLAGALACRLSGVPLILEVNAPLAQEKARYGTVYCKKLAQWMETYVIKNAFRTIAVSGVLRDILIRNGGRAERIVVMHNGVNPAEYPREMSNPPERASGGKRITLGFVGWFRDWHGLSEMLFALDDQGLFQRNVHLLLIGDGPLRPQLEAAIAERGLAEHVTITGALDRPSLLRLLPSLDITLQPAATEYASPMKLFEYMAAGRAVVAPDQPNIREIITDGVNGLLFHPGDWAHMVRRVGELAAAPDYIRRLGDAAREDIALHDRTWLGNARRVAQLLPHT